MLVLGFCLGVGFSALLIGGIPFAGWLMCRADERAEVKQAVDRLIAETSHVRS